MSRRIQKKSGAKYQAALTWLRRSGFELRRDMLDNLEKGTIDYKKVDEALFEKALEYFTEDRRTP